VRLVDDLAQRVARLGLGVADDDEAVQPELRALGAADAVGVLAQVGELLAGAPARTAAWASG
jgi:hypothetical protein